MLWIKLVGLVFLLLGACLCFATLNVLWKKPRPAGGFVNPGLAIQFARSAADVERALHDVTAKDLLKSLKLDSQIFIPVYWTLLMVFSALLYRHQFAHAKWLGLAAGICATAAAACDYLENHRIKDMLTSPEINDATALGIRHASLLKWGLIFVAVALLATMFLWRRDWVMIVGALYLLAALIGIIGLFRNSLIQWAFAPMSLGMAGIGALLLFEPDRFLAGLS
jgi:hypothetical protein